MIISVLQYCETLTMIQYMKKEHLDDQMCSVIGLMSIGQLCTSIQTRPLVLYPSTLIKSVLHQLDNWVNLKLHQPVINAWFLAGLHYLHAEAPVKVIHRDLKSRNGNTQVFLLSAGYRTLIFFCPAAVTGFSALSCYSGDDSRQSAEGSYLCSFDVQKNPKRISAFFHSVQAHRSVCVLLTALSLSLSLSLSLWMFRFVTSGRLSSWPTPPTWRWWALFPGWLQKSSRAFLSQRPVIPTPMVWWVSSTAHAQPPKNRLTKCSCFTK